MTIRICGDVGMVKYRLGDICEIVSGSTPRTGVSEYWDGDKKWITPAEITDESYIITDSVRKLTELGVTKTGLSSFPKGTVILSSRAPIGKVAIAGCEMYCNQGFKNLICSQKIYNRYLYWFLKGSTEYLNSLGRGATFKEISKQIVASIEINVPDMGQQMQTAENLERVSSIIRLRKQQLQKLDDLVKARFVELFGAYPHNPMRWKTGTIRDVVTDVRYGSSRPAVDGGKYPYLRMNNITYGGELDLSDVKRIDVPENELEKCTVRRGDVLFNRTNSKELVGKTCVYDRDEMMVLAGFVIRVRVNDLVLPEFLSAFLNTEFSKRTLLGMCKAAIGQANINAQEMQNIGIYIPPIELQREFVQFKNQTDKSKSAVQKALNETQLLFDSLMQKYFE